VKLKYLLTLLIISPLFLFSYSKTEMRSIIKTYKLIQKNIKRHRYKTKEHKVSYDDEGIEAEAKIYIQKRRKKKIIRKLYCSGGTDSSAGSAEYYYKINGKLFFSFLRTANTKKCWSELRNYYDSKGNLIKRLRKDGKKCPAEWFFPPKIDNPLDGYKNFCGGKIDELKDEDE